MTVTFDFPDPDWQRIVDALCTQFVYPAAQLKNPTLTKDAFASEQIIRRVITDTQRIEAILMAQQIQPMAISAATTLTTSKGDVINVTP